MGKWLQSLREGQGKWFVLTAVVSIALTAGITVLAMSNRLGESGVEAQSTPLATPLLPDTVSASGYLEPQGEVITISAPAFAEGTRVEELLVEEGDYLSSGDVIAILDNRDRLEAALKIAQQRVKVAQASLEQVQAGAKQGAINAQKATIERLKAELAGQILAQEATIDSLKSRLEGDQTAQEAIVKRLQAQLDNAETECRRYRDLYNNGAVAESLYDSVCLEAQTLREQRQEAQSVLFRIVNTLSQDILEAQANLSRTQTTLEREIREAEARLEEIAEIRPVDLNLARAELSEAIAAVAQSQANLDLAFVKTRRAGQVLEINTYPGELVNNNGIVELGQTQQMYAVAEVYETDIHRVQVNQKAIIQADSLDGFIEGEVDEIGLKIGKKDVLGTDPTAEVDARVVEVRIRLNDSEKVASLTNLTVDVLIDVSSQP
ncbi:MAG: biotin/lipoyl-binding protein [Oscillatoria sp. PMC 1068.18]|nr:biotin/lipoyl-binding protein [Oscillatoria sp. PMC 1076.18]MEC4987801.1 biotin/lipoyl-binding protein [Oscillatoria sp. PMC 1068.18]